MIPDHKARKRLDQLIRNSEADDYASVSVLIGKNHAYIQQFIRRGIPKRLKEEDRRKIAAHFNVPEWELGGPLEASVPGPRGKRGFSDSPPMGIHLIPCYDVRASAGFGAFVDREWAEDYLPFQTAFLRNLTQTSPDRLTAIKVAGDSMAPTLNDGDTILVDPEETTPGREGVFVIRSDEILNVKRISANPGTGLLTIKSDNTLYDDWPNIDPKTITIIGKVLWAGRKL